MATPGNNAGQTWNADVRQWQRRFGLQLDALARQAVQEISYRVVAATPVDTGFLRSSWQPTIGLPAGSDASSGNPEAKLAVTVNGMKAGDRFYMINNAAYAKRLEWGFVGEDKLGRRFNQNGRYFVTGQLKRWPQVVAAVAKDLAR